MTEATNGLENKANSGVDAMFGEFMGAFEEFKRTNDGRLAELEKRGSADALTEDKLSRLNAALDSAKAAIDRANVERARPRLEGGRPDAGDEYKDAFAAYVKHGEEKALRVGSNPDGGYLVPTETDEEITRLMAALSPIRSIASIRQVSTSVYKKPVTTTGPAVGWVPRPRRGPRPTARSSMR